MVSGIIAGTQEELADILEQNKDILEEYGSARIEVSGGPLARLFLGDPYKRGLKKAMKRAEKRGMHIVIVEEHCYRGYCQGNHGQDEYILWCRGYRLAPDAPEGQTSSETVSDHLNSVLDEWNPTPNNL